MSEIWPLTEFNFKTKFCFLCVSEKIHFKFNLGSSFSCFDQKWYVNQSQLHITLWSQWYYGMCSCVYTFVFDGGYNEAGAQKHSACKRSIRDQEKPIELHMQNEKKCKSLKGGAQIDSLRPKKVPYSLCRDVMARACTESNQRSKGKLEARFPFKIPPILHTYTCQSAICDWFTFLLSKLYFNHF